MHIRRARCFLLGLGLAGAPYAMAGDTSGTMRVGDMQYGNALDPRGWTPMMQPADPDGMSLLHAGMLRTPTGIPYAWPAQVDDLKPLGKATDWTWSGLIELGFLHVGGDRNAQFFRQYADWKTGAALGLLALDFQNAKTGDYVEFRGSRLSGDDQFYRLRAGRYGSLRVEAFYRDMPHAVATNAYPLWNGVGGTNLTLPAPLVAGASTPAAEAAVHAASSRRTIGLTRTREGIGIEGALYRNWIGAASVTNEKRTGTRLWGGTMFFNFPFPDNGGVFETVRPIDFRTTDVNLSLRNVGKTWRFLATYNGSFFRNRKDHLDYESPYSLYNVAGVPQVADIKYGEFSLEPDNDYHNLRLDLSRELKGNGQFSIATAYGTMRQNDSLRPPTTCSGTGGIFIAPPVDYTFNCADWNTTAALSRQNANARIDTGLVDARLSFRPAPTFGWHANLRWYREDNKTRYLAYNPITGQYGYISENGSQGSVVPGEVGIFDPRNPLFSSANVTVRNVPYGYTDTLFELGGEWQASPRQSVAATYTFDHNEPKYRERKRVDENRLKLEYTARNLGGATIRASYEYARRDGSRYDYDPYERFFSESLPGFVDPLTGIAAHTVEDMRKYDLSDRKQGKGRLIATYPWGESVTLSATFYGTREQYDARIGRQDSHTTGSTLQWDWSPTPATSMNVYLGAESTRLGISNVADVEGLIGADIGQTDPALGGPLYPYANQWWEFDRERNRNAGLTFSHDFGRVRADISYNYTGSFGHVGYRYASLAALAYQGPDAAAQAGDALPDNHYRVNTLDLGLTFRFTQQFGMRLFGRYERGSFSDFHYAGFDESLDYDHRIYTDQGPDRHYSASVVGAMFQVKL